jgi:hypothetical protein
MKKKKKEIRGKTKSHNKAQRVSRVSPRFTPSKVPWPPVWLSLGQESVIPSNVTPETSPPSEISPAHAADEPLSSQVPAKVAGGVHDGEGDACQPAGRPVLEAAFDSSNAEAPVGNDLVWE